MKRILNFGLLGSMICLGSFGMAGTNPEIVKVIEEAYIDGIHRNSDIEAIKKGFHPSFNMLILKDGDIRTVTLADWISRIEARKKRPSNGKKKETTFKVTMTNEEGMAALARVEVYKDGKHVYTDFMSLYRFESGWRIVGKIFQSH